MTHLSENCVPGDAGYNVSNFDKPKNTAYNAILNVPLGDFKDYGFELRELGDHILELYHQGKKIASYNQTTVTPEIIRQGCHNYLVNYLRWIREREDI